MKKYLALGLLSLCGAMCVAQEALEPIVIPDATARKISSDGKWVACYGMAIVVYNVETKNSEIYPECSLGRGNAVALDGTVVGSKEDLSVFLKDGKIIEPKILNDYEFSGINGITSDGTKITGFVKNPDLVGNDEVDPYDNGIPVYLPFYSEVTADCTIEKVNILPIPEKDFLGYPPMYVTAEWISEDGQTILGTMTDSYGRFNDPIVYKQSSTGEWTYSLPTKEFNNPTGIVLPENPWAKFPDEPNYKDYMSALQYTAYQAAIQKFLLGEGPEVDPFEYMTEAMAQKYIADYEAYENYFQNHKSEIDAYEKAYRQILETSTYFGEAAMDPQGAIFAVDAISYDQEGTDAPSKILIFNTETGEYQTITSKYSGLNVHQVLTDGTILGYTGLFTYEVLQGYILLPNETDFMPFADYLAKVNPGYASWLNEVFPKGEGIISASQDLSIIAGGLDILSAASESIFPNSTILSYVLPDMTGAGIEDIVVPVENGVYKVYNLMGVKVLETKDIQEIKNLGRGIYIINGKKVLI